MKYTKMEPEYVQSVTNGEAMKPKHHEGVMGRDYRGSRTVATSPTDKLQMFVRNKETNCNVVEVASAGNSNYEVLELKGRTAETVVDEMWIAAEERNKWAMTAKTRYLELRGKIAKYLKLLKNGDIPNSLKTVTKDYTAEIAKCDRQKLVTKIKETRVKMHTERDLMVKATPWLSPERHNPIIWIGECCQRMGLWPSAGTDGKSREDTSEVPRTLIHEDLIEKVRHVDVHLAHMLRAKMRKCKSHHESMKELEMMGFSDEKCDELDKPSEDTMSMSVNTTEMLIDQATSKLPEDHAHKLMEPLLQIVQELRKEVAQIKSEKRSKSSGTVKRQSVATTGSQKKPTSQSRPQRPRESQGSNNVRGQANFARHPNGDRTKKSGGYKKSKNGKGTASQRRR